MLPTLTLRGVRQEATADAQIKLTAFQATHDAEMSQWKQAFEAETAILQAQVRRARTRTVPQIPACSCAPRTHPAQLVAGLEQSVQRVTELEAALAAERARHGPA